MLLSITGKEFQKHCTAVTSDLEKNNCSCHFGSLKIILIGLIKSFPRKEFSCIDCDAQYWSYQGVCPQMRIAGLCPSL